MSHAADAPPPPRRSLFRSSAASLALLWLAILATFGRLLASDFTWWDDQGTLHQNPLFNPPTLATLRFYWSRPSLGLYVPVTDTVWAAIAKVAYVGVPDEFNVSLNPWLFHAANVALHLGSAALVFAILRRLLTAPAPAFLGAMLFAVHPLQVESVAWISGMKDLLCWFGSLGVAWIYLRRVDAIRTTRRPLWASWEMPVAALALALSILSKPTAIVAPAALLAIDGLALRRRWTRAFVELLPLFALSLAGAAVARVAQAVGPRQDVALWLRPFVVGDGLAFYLEKFAWPFSLAVDYGRTPTLVLASGWTYVRWLAPAAIAALLFWRRRSLPLPALAGALVVIGIAPVSGVATFQMQQFSTTADHYVYFSMLGPALALAWALDRWPRRSLRVAAAILLVGLACRSADQCRHWRDTFALFEQTMRVNPRSMAAHNNLAAVQSRRQNPRLDIAEEQARLALALEPENYYALETVGIIEGRLGKARESDEAFETLWMLCDRFRVGPQLKLDASRNAFVAMLQSGDLDRAVAWAKRSAEVAPDDPKVRGDLAYAMKLAREHPMTARPTTTTTTATTSITTSR